MLYIYLHGFNSAFDPDANKVKSLSTLGDVIGITYDTFESYDNIFSYITSQVPADRLNEVVFAGTSLGGFWAAQMGKHYGCPSIIINPCYDPGSMLGRYEGVIMTNYYTAVHNVLTQAAIDTYASKYIYGQDKTYKYLPLVLLDMGDEVIGSSGTALVLKEFTVKCFQGGSHRFDHMDEALDDIRNYVNHCDYVEHLDA
jgi:predicted esterase YcpF (UPF0227 family)